MNCLVKPYENHRQKPRGDTIILREAEFAETVLPGTSGGSAIEVGIISDRARMACER
jgi:hypothetical protein